MEKRIFAKAIVRRPPKSVKNGITSSNLGLPDFPIALQQHNNYVEILKECGLEVEVLEPDETYPDCCFVEDTAICTEKFVLITRPGASSRAGEIDSIKEILKKYSRQIEEINEPGTLDGGDVMRAENHFYIGLSLRTNKNGASQLISILEKYGFTGSTVPLAKMLHLKSGVSYLGNNNLLMSEFFINEPAFKKLNQIIVSEQESYAINCLLINQNLIVPEGFPQVLKSVENLGFKIYQINIHEYRKIDGGLTCLSLLF